MRLGPLAYGDQRTAFVSRKGRMLVEAIFGTRYHCRAIGAGRGTAPQQTFISD